MADPGSKTPPIPDDVKASADDAVAPGQAVAAKPSAPTGNDEASAEEEMAAAAASSPQQKNAFPSMGHSDKPPFDIGIGWLDWADRKAAQIFEAVWDGAKDYVDGKGRVQDMDAQNAKHHGHFHHKSNEMPSSPPPTPSAEPHPALSGKPSGFRGK